MAGALGIFELETYLSDMEGRAEHDMGASDSETLTIGELLAFSSPADQAAFMAQSLTYSTTRGADDLRAAIAATYETVNVDDVMCFCGAEEGIYVAMHQLLSSTDHAIVVTPCYQSAETIPRSICAVTAVPLDPSDGWSLDIDRIAEAIGPRTKLIYINYPHNPTGRVLERDRLDALIALCRQHGLWLLNDEVYRLIERRPELRLPQIADVYERGISLNVLSKALGLPGLRLGWIACKDPRLLLEMEKARQYLSVCNSVPSERLALFALKASERIVARNQAIAEKNLAVLHELFTEFDDLLQWRSPDGGCIGFPRYTGPEGAQVFVKNIHRDAGILLVPGHLFVSQPNDRIGQHFRIGFGRTSASEGMDAMSDWLHARREVIAKIRSRCRPDGSTQCNTPQGTPGHLADAGVDIVPLQ